MNIVLVASAITGSKTATVLTALHKELQSGPLARNLPFPYHPHVTVAHDVSEAGMDRAMESLNDYEAQFTVRTIGLYEHDATGLWTHREELDLRA